MHVLIFLITAQHWCTLLLYLLLTPPCSRNRNNKSLTWFFLFFPSFVCDDGWYLPYTESHSSAPTLKHSYGFFFQNLKPPPPTFRFFCQLKKTPSTDHMHTFYHLNKGVCHTVALPFTLKSIWRQQKNYENSNISPCQKIIFKKSSKRNQNPSSYYNSITHLKFQHKPKYHLSKILI
jgi:hypothetical protein